MSHHPPHGPGGPPPYYQPGYPPPPGSSGYAYVPAPVMMPMPVYQPPPPQPSQPEQPPNNTYVTNIIYQQPDQVQVVDNSGMIDWVQASSTTIHSFHGRAFVAGHEGWDNSPLWVIRARYGGDFVPGKLAAKHQTAYIPFGGKEVRVFDFEVMLAPPHIVRWVPSSNGSVPPGAIPAGNTASGEPLYIGRARYMQSLTPGKVHPSHGCAYICFGGSEVSLRVYEVLCSV